MALDSHIGKATTGVVGNLLPQGKGRDDINGRHWDQSTLVPNHPSWLRLQLAWAKDLTKPHLPSKFRVFLSFHKAKENNESKGGEAREYLKRGGGRQKCWLLLAKQAAK